VTQLHVPDAAAGRRLDSFLAELPEIGSRAVAERLVNAGGVLVDGRTRPKSHKLAGGEELEFEPPAAPTSALEPQEMDLTVPYEDEHLLVVDKPAGLVVHPAPGHAQETLVHGLLAYDIEGGDERERPGIVHRLDRDTSGLLVVARSPEAHRRLQELVQSRGLTREYLALVVGRPRSRKGTIDAPIGRDRRHPERVSTDTDAPREATTDFAVERALPHSSLLRVRLRTGRTHQIRVHLEAIGHPIVGDPVYAGRAPAETYGLQRQFLHAERLAFDHPVTGGRVDVRSPLPDDLVAALERAERRGGSSTATPRSD
jgi:23S rRNA pseudouridine1911/1915/1917 synthase